jgi:Bacterial Ig-like domain/Viral BACON domain/Bacterial Ig domain
MLKSPKTVAGRIQRKIFALLMAYSFLANSAWSLNPPGQSFAKHALLGWAGWQAQRNPLAALASASGGTESLVPGNTHRQLVPKIFSNTPGLRASMAAAQGDSGQELVGDQTIESNIDSNSTGLAEAFPATATAGGQVGSINVFLDETSAATKIYVGIYSDSGGHPANLLTQGSSTQLFPGTWNTVIVTPVNITSGSAYWIAILGTTGGVPVFRDRTTTTCHSLTSSQSTLTSLPSSWSTGQSWNTCYISAYAVSATSPATVLIGDQAVESYLDKNPAGRAEAFPALANATGSVGAIALYLDPTSGSGPVYAGLYADNNNHPGTLLGQGSTTQPVAGSWNQITIAPSNITAGQRYWIAVLGTQATSPYFRDRQTNVCHSETTPQTTLTSLPSTWTTGTIWSTCYISAYGLPAAGSVLTVSPASISFAGTQPGPNPAPANVSITNAGSGSLSFSVSTDVPWLTASPASGTAPQTVQVSAATGSLAPGTYTGHVTVTASGAQGSPAVSTVTFTVVPDVPPAITASASPAPNAAGWNNSNVTVSFVCAAGSYPLASCSPTMVVSTEGANQSTCGQAVDTAGFSATACVKVSLDKTPPIITAATNPPPNAAGWNTSNVTITYTCSDSLSGVVACPSQQVVSTEGKAQQTSATVSDQAGNTATASVTLNIEKSSPGISASVNPAPNAAGWNNTSVTVNFTCTPAVSDIVSCQSPITVSTEGKGQSITGTVTDQAGHSNTAVVAVNIDETPPLISASAAPAPNAAGWNNTNVVITYLCSDSLSGIALCPAPATVSSEGAAQIISAQATDLAGNTSSVSTKLNIDKTPPVVTATAAPSPNGAGWNNSNVTVTFACSDNLSGVASCPPQQLVGSEGQNQNISGPATDVAGNTATGSISVSIDKTPPTIVQLSTPDHISALSVGQVSVTVTDNFTVSQVVISVNGTPLGTFTTPPYQTNLQVPAGANPGDTLTVTAVATDEAGNTQTASRGVSVTANGVVVGQVLSDATGLPMQGAGVQLIATTGQSDQTDSKGRYSFQASDTHLFLSATNSGTTTVEREIFIQPGAGTVAIDARLTPLAPPVPVGSAGGTLTAGAISISIPAASVANGTNFQLTPLSGQGLPGLLPLGWSPLAAFDLRASASVSELPAVVSQLPGLVMHLATYNAALHGWTIVASNLQSVNGACSFTVPGPGAYALVVPDTTTPPIPIPDPGSPLTGIAVQAIDPAASSTGSLNPAMLPPAGGTATATLGLQSPSFAPSGTIVQANVSETFSLASGDVVSEQTRSEDILLYNALAPPNSTMGAQFPVTPSHQYTLTQLVTGKVHLDILAGREGVRGQPGGNDPLTIGDGVATLSVPGGALSQDTAISVESTSLENFVPTSSSMGALQEVLVDFSGEILNTPAQLSISAGSLNPNDTFLLTQVQRINGVPHMVTVALAQIHGSTLSSVASPGLPGVTQGGEYVFYDISAPVGFVQGVTSSTAGPVSALVLTDSLSIAAISGADGRYIVPALAGTANLKASAPNTSLAGTASAQVVAGQTVVVNILLAGTVTAAVVSPADGTLGVPTSTIITITTSAPLNPQSIVQSNLSLAKGPASAPGAPVPLQPFILSTAGTTLTFAPASNLDPATQYTIQVSGLADTSGGAISVPTSSFTTKAAAPLNFDPNAITFAFPDQNGNIHVSAPAGSLPPGTTVLIVDQSNAVVISLTALNDGSVSGDFPGTINDLLQVTVTDPNGATTTFTRSQFVAPDGSVAVGPGGGTVTGPGGVRLLIPAGALDTAAKFTISTFDATQFPDSPNVPNGVFAAGLHVVSPDMPTFKQEVKLSFPKPAGAPDGTFYYVYRRLVDTGDGHGVFQTIDHAFVDTQDPTKVTTASFPFAGYSDSFGNIASIGGVGGFAINSLADQWFLMMSSFDRLAIGVLSQGIITGKVRRTIAPTNGQQDPTFVGIAGAKVWKAEEGENPSHVAITDAQGTFTLFDPVVGGGTRLIKVLLQTGEELEATAFEAGGPQPDDGFYGIDGNLYATYKNVGRVTVNFPALTPPPPPPQLSIGVFRTAPNGSRVDAGGLVQTGTPLKIGIIVGNGQNLLNPVLKLDGVSLSLAADAPGAAPQMAQIVTPDFVAADPGTHTISASSTMPDGTQAVATRSFRVLAGGQSNFTPDPSGPPRVVSSFPMNHAQRVLPTVFPELDFSEPVTNVPSNIVMTDSHGTSVAFKILATGMPDATGNPVSIDNLTDPSTKVVAVTLQPIKGLRYGETYTITVLPGIVDTDSPPERILDFSMDFTILVAEKLASLDDVFPAPHVVPLKDILWTSEAQTGL